MSKYKRFCPSEVRGHSLVSRKSKVDISDFSRPAAGTSFQGFVASIPNLLAGVEIRALADRIHKARARKRALIWGFGGHVIKVGLAPLLIDLMRRGYVTGFATNGSGLIHDFEIAHSGSTSEDVEAQLPSGDFGMTTETAIEINGAISRGSAQDLGIGESVGQSLIESQPKFSKYSVLAEAYREGIPVTVHVAFGTDVIHHHPSASGEATGKATQIDFQIFTQLVSRLDKGGVYLNLGSAVILPEVFLKAVSLVRNSGQELESFTTANLDFIQHYRPLQNVVKRPVAGSGRGFGLTGHHEILVPLLAAMLAAEDTG